MNICVVGGGTAGWIAALMLSKKTRHNITVIESSQIPIIGVGEGTTGKFTDLFVDPALGLDEFEFIQKSKALPKYGIEFVNWRGKSDVFYSPIEGSATCNLNFDTFLYNAIYNDIDISLASLSGHYYKHNIVPWYMENDSLNWKGGRAYHIDAYKVGEYFKEKSIESGVTHIDAKVEQVITKNNEIEKLLLDNKEYIQSDFFIDCSGFSQVLMSSLSNEWLDYSRRLPTNSALIYKIINDVREKKMYTRATALDNGWVFEIPTRDKIGSGYIYSADFATEDLVQKELEIKYNKKIEPIKTIKFQAGRYADSWTSNCLSLGLSSVFIEPLQATSLHISINQIDTFIHDFLLDTKENTCVEIAQKKFNAKFSRMTDHLLDFVQMTYFGGRNDTEFWKFMDKETSKSIRLLDIVELTKHRLTRKDDFEQYMGCADQAIWNYTLAGLGYYSKDKIKKVLDNLNFDIDDINQQWSNHHQQIEQGIKESNFMTVEELNNTLKDLENINFEEIKKINEV
jgi:hypothetical protein